MNLKNTSILIIISVSSLGLLSSCSNKESVKKPATFSGSYKIVAFTCGTSQITFPAENSSEDLNSTSNPFVPHGFEYYFAPPTDSDTGIKYENGVISFEHTEIKDKGTR